MPKKIWQKRFIKSQCGRPSHLWHMGFFLNCLKLPNSKLDVDNDDDDDDDDDAADELSLQNG